MGLFEKVLTGFGLFFISLGIFITGIIVLLAANTTTSDEAYILQSGYVVKLNMSKDLQKVTSLGNLFSNPESRYSIQYPAGWEYDNQGNGAVIMTGKAGTLSYLSNINIQTIRTNKTGGMYHSVEEFMRGIKQQISHQLPNSKFLEAGPISLTLSDGSKVQGQYLIFVYGYNGLAYKKWQVVVQRNDGQVFYAWAFTSPLQQYPRDLATAQAMLQSWDIY